MNVSIARNGVELGEWSREAVISYLGEGRLVPSDSYWHEGMDSWQPLSRLAPPPFPDAKPELLAQRRSGFWTRQWDSEQGRGFRQAAMLMVPLLAAALGREAFKNASTVQQGLALSAFLGFIISIPPWLLAQKRKRTQWVYPVSCVLLSLLFGALAAIPVSIAGCIYLKLSKPRP